MATEGHGRLATGWTVYSCSSPDANNITGCTVRNDHGDDARVIVKGAQLGAPTAVTNVLLDLTTYPSAPDQYVSARCSRPATTTTSSGWPGCPTRPCSPSSPAAFRGTQNPAPEPIDGTTSKVIIRGIGADYGKEMQFKVLTSPGGKANAVKELLSSQSLTGLTSSRHMAWRVADRATYSPGTIFARPPEGPHGPATCDPPCWPASSPPPWA